DHRVVPRARQARAGRRDAGHRRRLRADPAGARPGGAAQHDGGRMIIRKSDREIDTMARAGRVVADTLALMQESIRPGVTTGELDAIAEEFIRSQGGRPTFKGYRGYPAAICASPNAMVVHGIPGEYALDEGDVLSVDVGVTLDGFVGD